MADEQDVPLPIDSLRRLACIVLEEENLPPQTEVGISFIADEEMEAHNRRFLDGEGPTDVLALPLIPPGSRFPVPDSATPEVPFGIGDVFVAPSYVRRQALELDTDPHHEMSLMVVHGLLHLLGYDHENGDDAALMEGRERTLLALVGIDRR